MVFCWASVERSPEICAVAFRSPCTELVLVSPNAVVSLLPTSTVIDQFLMFPIAVPPQVTDPSRPFKLVVATAAP
jgi:hypothetical protein